MFDDGELKKFEQAEYRVKILRIGWREVVEYLYGQTGLPEYVTFPRHGLPEGNKVVAVDRGHDPFVIRAYITHPSFPEVENGEQPDYYNGPAFYEQYALATKAEADARYDDNLRRTDGEPVFVPVKKWEGR